MPHLETFPLKVGQSFMLGAVCLVLAMAAFGTSPAVRAAETGSTASSAEQCLACHGPFDKLAEKTKDWKDEFGDPVNPHVWIDKDAAKPHNARQMPPDCLKCHEAHPIPPKADWKPKQKPDVSYCYGCHHMETFEPCGQSGCHEGRS